MKIDGRWQLTVHSPMGRRQAILDVRANGYQMLGSMTDPTSGAVADIFDGMVDGITINWKVRMRHLGLTAVFTATVDGNSMAGKVRTGIFGTYDVDGNRDS